MELEGSLPHLKKPQLVSVLSHINLIKFLLLLSKGTLECYLAINAPVFQGFYFSQISTPKFFYANSFSTIHATCPAHLIGLDFITSVYLLRWTVV
jgi:hypothetical protein